MAAGESATAEGVTATTSRGEEEEDGEATRSSLWIFSRWANNSASSSDSPVATAATATGTGTGTGLSATGEVGGGGCGAEAFWIGIERSSSTAVDEVG